VIGADDVVTRIGLPVTAMVMQNSTGRQLAEFPSPPGLPVMQFVWRAELYRALADEAERRGVRTEHGKRLVGLDNDRDGVTAHFADGTHATADVLIGADGIRSTTRSLIDPNAPQPRYTKLISFGGRTDDMGLPSTNGKMHFVFGRRAFFGYQVGDDRSGGWFVNLPSDTALTRAQCNEIPAQQWLATLREAFAKDASPASAILSRASAMTVTCSCVGSSTSAPRRAATARAASSQPNGSRPRGGTSCTRRTCRVIRHRCSPAGDSASTRCPARASTVAHCRAVSPAPSLSRISMTASEFPRPGLAPCPPGAQGLGALFRHAPCLGRVISI